MGYTLEEDEKLGSIVKDIPKNAKSTSKDIQNEIIITLADLLVGQKNVKMLILQGFALRVMGQVMGVSRDKYSVKSISNYRGASYWFV